MERRMETLNGTIEVIDRRGLHGMKQFAEQEAADAA